MKQKTFMKVGDRKFRCLSCGFESTQMGVRSHVGSFKCKQNQLNQRAIK